MIGLGWIIAEYTKKIQAAGSLYTYVSDGLGGRVGAAVGWLYYTGILALSAGILVMIGGTIHDTLLGEFNFHAIPYWGWDVILFALVAVVMYLGVALSTRLQLVLALISVTVVLIFSVYVIIKSGGLHHIGSGFSPNSVRPPTGRASSSACSTAYCSSPVSSRRPTWVKRPTSPSATFRARSCSR